MAKFSELMSGQTSLPMIQTDDPKVALNNARAMADIGITLVEVVMRSEHALNGLIEIKRELPEMIVGAGTVYNSKHLRSAMNAGADFIVTPTVTDNLLSQLYLCNVPVLPGVSNPGQVLQAYEFGFTELKFFPAQLSGGTEVLTALGSVFNDIQFCPTGGINESNKADYLALENVFAVAGRWMFNDATETESD